MRAVWEGDAWRRPYPPVHDVLRAVRFIADQEAFEEVPNRRTNSPSSMICVPNDRAFSSFEPGSAPTTRNVVIFDTEFVTRPPAASIIAEACSRDSDGSVPVMTTVIPSKTPPAWTWRGSVKLTP